MLTIDPNTTTISVAVDRKAATVAGQLAGLRYAYLDDPSRTLQDTPRHDRGGLWQARATFPGPGGRRTVEVYGGSPDRAAPLGGLGWAYCSCPAHTYRRLCGHIVATWRVAADAHGLPVGVAA